jgi:hypothetical protein
MPSKPPVACEPIEPRVIEPTFSIGGYAARETTLNTGLKKDALKDL